jgi:hypothetical protein
MDTNLIGAIGEQRLILELLTNNFEVFTSITGKSKVDIVAILNNITFRFQVKTCLKTNKYNRYLVQLKSVRPNRTENVIHKFDGLSCDILACYCVEHNVMQYFTCLELDNRAQLNINPLDFNTNSINKILRDYTQNILPGNAEDDDIVQTTTV